MTKCLLAIFACVLLCLIFTCTCTLACKEVSRERERGEREREKEEGGARKIHVTDVVTNYILIDVRLMINCYISVCVCVYVFTCTVCVCVCLMRSKHAGFTLGKRVSE